MGEVGSHATLTQDVLSGIGMQLPCNGYFLDIANMHYRATSMVSASHSISSMLPERIACSWCQQLKGSGMAFHFI